MTSPTLENYRSDITFFADYTRNSFVEEIQGITPTVNSTPSWANTSKGRGLKCIRDVDEGLLYTDASYAFSGGTVIIVCARDEINSGLCEVVANTSGGLDFLFSGTNVGFWDYDTSAYRASGIAITDYKPHAYASVLKDGVASGSNTFVDGVKGADVTWTATASAASLRVGFGVNAGLGAKSTILFVAIIDRTDITEEDISKISTELLRGQGALSIATRNYHLPAPEELDSSLVLDMDMTTPAGAGKIADLTGGGNNGTIVDSIITTPDGVYGGSRVCGAGYINLPGSNSDFFGADYSVETIIKQTSQVGVLIVFGITQVGKYSGVTGPALITSYIDGSSIQKTFSSTSFMIQDEWNHCISTLSISSSDVTVKHYINGEAAGSQTLSSGFQALTPAVPIIGAFNSSSLFFTGLVNNLRYFSKALTQTEATARYAEYAKKLNFHQAMAVIPPTLANVTEGKIGETDFTHFGGTWKVSEDPKSDGSEKIVGGMTAGGYTPVNNAALTNPTADVLRIAYTDTNFPVGQQIILTSGRPYRVTGEARVSTEGSHTAWIYVGAGGDADWVGTPNMTTWQEFDFVATADATDLNLLMAGTGSGYVEFRNLSVVEADEGQKWMEAAAASTFANLNFVKPYGTYIFRANRGTGNVIYYPISDTANDISVNINAYRFIVTSSGDFRIQRVTNGVGVSTLVQSPTGTFSASTDYEFAVTRRNDGLFTGYYKELGGTWAIIPKNGGGDLTVTDNTFKTSVAQMLQPDSGAKLGEFITLQGELTLAQLQADY